MSEGFKPVFNATDMDEDYLKKVCDVTFQAMT